MKTNVRLKWGIIAVAALLVLIGLGVGLFFANGFRVDVELKGEQTLTLEVGSAYTDEGADAYLRGKLFMKEGEAFAPAVENTVDPQKLGTYTVTYTARKWKKIGSATRTVTVVDTQVPTLTLAGEGEISLTRGNAYNEPGFTAADNYDGDLTAKVVVTGEVDTSKSGTYTLTYNVQDSSGNAAPAATRTVKVKAPAVVRPVVSIPETGTVVPGNKTIYLTFDDGPGPYTAKLLDVLKKYNVKATFFVVDTGSGYYPLLTRMANEGHSIGIHSTSHHYKTIYASEEAFFNDLYNMQNIIKTHTGITTMLTRFPGGSSNTVSQFNPGIMSRLAVSLTEKGFRYFDWNVSSGDAGEATSTAQVVRNIKNGINSNGKYSIVLQHDIKNFSVNAVEEIIQWGLANGYTFAPLDMTSPTCHHGINN
ncbi:MAG: polysaccharide deacetylase family protein [Clostridia bacterium]|nr:polysaccharide deacetylase family protein [Clostridia bacterium]